LINIGGTAGNVYLTGTVNSLGTPTEEGLDFIINGFTFLERLSRRSRLPQATG